MGRHAALRGEKEMKRIFYTILTSLAVTACSDELQQAFGDAADCETVNVDFSVGLPGDAAQTKAMATAPDIRNLYVAVFDESGYLYEYKQATASAVTSNGISGARNYEVELKTVKGKKRTVHFIANAPESVNFGSEEEVVASMVAYAQPAEGQVGPDVYWQRIDLPDGICFEPGTETTTRQLIASSRARLASVGLVRNFAKLTVRVEASGCDLVDAVLVNAPDRCYVAPYNRSESRFQSDYQNFSTQELISDGYLGATPPTTRFVKDFTNVQTAVGGEVNFFMLERETPLSNPTCVIVGVMRNSVKRYYKVNLLDDDENLYPILRNFNYEVILAAVFNNGYDTVEEAYNSSGSGDISTNIEYEELTSISNGVSFLSVGYTEKVVVDNNAFTLDYKFIPDLEDTYSEGQHAGEMVVCNDVAALTDDGVLIQLVGAGSLGAAIESFSVADSDNPDLSRTITIIPTEPSALPKSQDIIITGQHMVNVDGEMVLTTIRRKVTIVVRGIYNMGLSCTPELVEAGVGKTVTLNIKLPEGLPSAIFPLDFSIEGENLSISPLDGDVSVSTGPSIIEGSTRPSAFHYNKIVNFSDYFDGNDYNVTFPVHFRTNTVSSATAIYVANEYFNTASTAFENPHMFTGMSFSPISVSNTLALSFSMETSDPVTVSLDGLAPAAGSGLVPNSDGTYTYTPSATGVQSIDLTWDGSARFSATVSAPGYLDASKSGGNLAVEFAPQWYTGYSEADNHIAQDVATTLTALVRTSDTDNTTVTFEVAGRSPITATRGALQNGSYIYTASYTPSGSGTLAFKVKAVCDDLLAEDEESAVVWKKVVAEDTREAGQPLTSASFNTSTDYLLYNPAAERYLYVRNNTLSVNSTLTLNESFFFSFGSTKSPASIKNVSSGRYIAVANNNPSLSRDSSDLKVVVYNRTAKTFTIQDSRYLSANSNSVSASKKTSDDTAWQIIPVTITPGRTYWTDPSSSGGSEGFDTEPGEY